MKNILITFLFKEGAGPVFTLEMAKGLALNNCNVYAILSNQIANKKNWEKEELIKDIQFIDTGNRKTAIQATIKFFLNDKFKIRNKYKDIKFDYAISTFYHPWATTILNCVKAKKITICHDPIHHSGVKAIEEILTSNYIKASDEVIVLTKSFIPLVEKNFGFSKEHIHHIPHGRMSEYKKIMLEPPATTSSNINFLFFGRIEKYKGLHILAKAYQELSKIHKNITLTVAGSGNFEEYKNDFKGLPHTTIINKYILDDEISQYFSNPNTILVLPYLDASQSGVIPIALEYETPIIASNTGGLKEQLNDGKIGVFCKANNQYSLQNAMNYYINNPLYINTEKSKMRSYLENLNWENIVQKIIII